MERGEPPREPGFAAAVRRLKDGDMDPFTELVTAFQDMAVGYAYSLLRDVALAEDAAQEAFLDAYRHIGSLREPMAFPSWLRRIVFKHCDRLSRRKTLPTLSLEDAGEQRLPGPSPADLAEREDMRQRLTEALRALPEKQRSVLVLHHMSGHSVAELSRFLGVPVTTVKKRLHDGRARLREIVEDGLTDGLRELRPSQDAAFARGVVELLRAAARGDVDRVKALLLATPRLRQGRDFMGNTALILAAARGHAELVALLLQGGAPIDIHEAAAIGDTERVRDMLDRSPELLDAYSEHGFTALALAAHFGAAETLRLLIERGGGVDTVSRHPIGVTPLHAALFGRQLETSRLLIASGADVTARRGGKGWPRAGWTPLHYAASLGWGELIQTLLSRGADPSARDDAGQTPLDVAREAEHGATVTALLETREGRA